MTIGTTHVYKKSTGALVDSRTAAGVNSYAKKMSAGTSTYIDVRLVTHAGNPFCLVGAIDGAINIRLTTAGSYSVLGGNHRQMPATYIYIYDWFGSATDVYKSDPGGVLCLLGNIVCDLRNFYGSGSY